MTSQPQGSVEHKTISSYASYAVDGMKINPNSRLLFLILPALNFALVVLFQSLNFCSSAIGIL
jgi:hypothetical protein